VSLRAQPSPAASPHPLPGAGEGFVDAGFVDAFGHRRRGSLSREREGFVDAFGHRRRGSLSREREGCVDAFGHRRRGSLSRERERVGVRVVA
jgi:hypothetical protein